jgi:hypothetical protein
MTRNAELEWYQWHSYFTWRVSRMPRGGKTRLAQHLGITRQCFNHWLNNGERIPGWAVVVITNYLNPLSPMADGTKRLAADISGAR